MKECNENRIKFVYAISWIVQILSSKKKEDENENNTKLVDGNKIIYKSSFQWIRGVVTLYKTYLKLRERKQKKKKKGDQIDSLYTYLFCFPFFFFSFSHTLFLQ